MTGSVGGHYDVVSEGTAGVLTSAFKLGLEKYKSPKVKCA